MKCSNNVKCSFTVLDALGILFVTLKLCGVIDWSWWWILLPFYGPLVLCLVAGAVLCGVIGIVTLAKKVTEDSKSESKKI